MNISPDIIEEAENVLKRPDRTLPEPIKVGEAKPVFFIGKISDRNIIAHTTIIFEGEQYKIGTKK